MDLKNMSQVDRRALAGNPNTSGDILRELAKGDDWGVRSYVARNTNIPLGLLTMLAQDEDSSVRWEVACNLRASGKILVTLLEYEKRLKDPHSYIICYLYSKPRLPYIAKVIIETLFGEILS